MKFTFYVYGKKKKQQVIKVKTNDDLLTVAKIVKCELTKNSILKDLDFSSNGKLMCIVKDKEFTMKELWSYLESKLKNSETTSNPKKKKDKSEKKKTKKKKSSIVGEKSKKSNKKSKKKSSKKKKKEKTNKPTNQNIKKTSNGLVHITRR